MSVMALLSRLQARMAIQDELRSRALVDDPTFEPPELEHVVGREVLVVCSDAGDCGLAETLSDIGYRVTLVDGAPDTWPLIKSDTVIVVGRVLGPAELDEVQARAKWATVLSNRDAPEGFEQRGPSAVREAYGEVVFRARTVQRSKTSDGWVYWLALADGRTLRATSEDEYPNGSTIVVSANAVIVAGEEFGLLNGKLVGSGLMAPDTTSEVLARAYREQRIREGRLVSTNEAVADAPEERRSQVKRLLRGYSGTRVALRALLDGPPTESGDELALPIERFSDSEDAGRELLSGLPHRVVGVILEPEVAYGPEGVWFSAETIRSIAQQCSQAALNHVDADPSQVRIVANTIDEAGQYAKPGSWLAECAVSDEVYEAICQGEYRGFSIKGVGLYAKRAGGED